MEREGDEAERREVQGEGRAPALPEEDVEADEQVDDAYQVDVDVVRGERLRRRQVVEVDVVEARLLRVRRSLDEVAYASADACLFQVVLNVVGRDDLLVFFLVEAYGDESVAGKDAEDALAPRGGVGLHRTRDDALRGLRPVNAVGRGRGVRESLREVERGGGDEHRRHNEQRPALRRQHGTLHRLTRDSFSSGL